MVNPLPLPLRRRLTAGALAACLLPPAQAGLFSVSPVRIFLGPRDRAVAVTVTNEGDQELVMQADVYAWSQKPGGEDELVLTEDLVLNPPVLKVPARSRQVVRLGLLRPAGDRQASYRLVLREVPEARPADSAVKVQIAVAFSLPVFITPPRAARQVACSLAPPVADKLEVRCENAGTAYAQVREVALRTPDGQKLTGRDFSAYLLPGVKRSFELPRNTTSTAGKGVLAVTFDDGVTQTFDASAAP